MPKKIKRYDIEATTSNFKVVKRKEGSFCYYKDVKKLEEHLDEFWDHLEYFYDIESRQELEEHAEAWESKNPLLVALHHIWKRDAKVAPLRGALEKHLDILEEECKEKHCVSLDDLTIVDDYHVELTFTVGELRKLKQLLKGEAHE